jgi:hypothetical protein
MAPPPSSSTNGGTSPNLYQYESAGVLDGNQIITNVSRKFSGRLGVYGYFAYGRIFPNTDGTGTFPANQFDLRQEYGRAATDIRHRFVLGRVFHGSARLCAQPVRGGKVRGPFNITTGRDTYNDSLFNERPVSPYAPSALITSLGAFDPTRRLGHR